MQIIDPYAPRKSKGKKWIRRLVFLAVAGAAVAVWTHRSGLSYRYHRWKQQRALRQAQAFIAKGDAPDAQVALQVAFQAVPGSPDAYRVAADMLEQIGAPQALRLREDVVQMLPSSVNDRLALANCALHFRDFNAARDALAGLTPDQAAQPLALGLALTFALDTENRPVADALLNRLRKLNPDNDDFKVAQAMLHLRHPNAAISGAARRDLEELASNPRYELRVRRELMADAVLRRDYPQAERWAALIVADPRSTLSDHLHQANLELLIDHRSFAEIYAQLSPLASSSAANAAEFVRWLLIQERAKDAAGWIAKLTPEMRGVPAVLDSQAEVSASLRDWDKLSAELIGGAWGPISADTVRLAMSAHLIGTRNNISLQHQVWEEVLQSAGRSLSALIALNRLCGVWGFSEEGERTLWSIAKYFPDQSWATEALFTIYHTRGDTANLRAVVALMLEANPTVPRMRHDWALLTLLTEPTDTWDKPKEMLAELYRQDPTDPFNATGYAFALAQSGKAAEALAIVEQMTPDQRQFSPRFPYLAYIYGVNRRRSEVEQLATQARGLLMLPEERRLFTEAIEASQRKVFLLPPLKPIQPFASPSK